MDIKKRGSRFVAFLLSWFVARGVRSERKGFINALRMKKGKPIVYVYPVSYYRPGKLYNFRNLFEFLLPKWEGLGCEVILCSLNQKKGDHQRNLTYFHEQGMTGRFRYYPYRRMLPSGIFLTQLTQLLINFIRLFFIVRKHQPGLVFCYNHIGAFYGGLLKSFFPFKLVFDMRGDRVSEFERQGKRLWQVGLSRTLERFVIKRASLVMPVSSAFVKRYPNVNQFVKLNYYNASRFYYNEEVARMKRKQLGLENRFVFVYSGTDRYYQMVPEMVRLFACFREKYPQSFFMVHTMSPFDGFLKWFHTYGVPDEAYDISKLHHSEVNERQMVADMAFLIREDLVLNHNAFPTKFCEYLASGVPVLTTPYLHAIAPLVKTNHMGIVASGDELFSMELFEHIYCGYLNNWPQKSRCAVYAKGNFSWQSQAHVVVDQLKGLTDV